ncbi:MAG TPA: PadR family transcriptional regulator [Candidatus Dietzia intestinigallinarum]|nr:PadR family transcriptional regulator [Candidatus Dietzia intestinigallinarum]
MSATATRLLLLGAVKIFEPVNAYQIRRELVSWDVDEWAHVNPGSVYSVLRTLTRQGFVDRHDITDAGRAVAVYTVTARGKAEFVQLMERGLTTVDHSEPLLFHTALAMLPHVEREPARVWLRSRIVQLRDTAGIPERRGSAAPPYVAEMLELWRREAAAQLDWCESLVARVEAGELHFSGEPAGSGPSTGEPAQMEAERARYREILGPV